MVAAGFDDVLPDDWAWRALKSSLEVWGAKSTYLKKEF
jgi:hypothetical protein